MDNCSILGGGAYTLLRQAVLMKRARYEIIVAACMYGGRVVCGDYLNICAEEGIKLIAQNAFVSNQTEDVDIFAVFNDYEGMRKLVEREKPDILHSVQLNITVELVSREMKIPHIMNIYQALPSFFILPYADVFPKYHICDSQYYADFWEKYAGTKSYCVRTVASEGCSKAKNPDSHTLRFICVGLVCVRKNQWEVIKAFGKLLESGVDARLDIWGHMDMQYVQNCLKYIGYHKLGQSIILHGFSENMEEIYSKSDAIICGSTSESYPNVISEALAYGVTVISTPIAGVPEIIKDRENGYLSKGYQADDILEAMIHYVRDYETVKSKQIAKNARSVYLNIHSEQAVAKQLIDCYEDILSDFTCRQRDKAQYSMENLKEDFSGILDCYDRNSDGLTDSEFVKKNLWKIKYVFDYIRRSKRDCYIWGAGKWGGFYREIMTEFAPDIKIKGFVDTYKTGTFMDSEIVKPDKIFLDKSCIILVGVKNQKIEIIGELEKRGFCYNEDCFLLETLSW